MCTDLTPSPIVARAVRARRCPPREAAGWSEAEVATVRRLWRAFLPVWAIAADLHRPRKTVQALARALDLPYLAPAAVERAGRMRVAAASLRRARAEALGRR